MSKIALFNFRAMDIHSKKWVYGFYAFNTVSKKTFIIQEDFEPYKVFTTFSEIEVIPETVGMLRHTNKYGSYYDGDVYYHAGYGMETVSDICELQFALARGDGDDICTIAGNIHDVPDIINKLNEIPT